MWFGTKNRVMWLHDAALCSARRTSADARQPNRVRLLSERSNLNSLVININVDLDRPRAHLSMTASVCMVRREQVFNKKAAARIRSRDEADADRLEGALYRSRGRLVGPMGQSRLGRHRNSDRRSEAYPARQKSRHGLRQTVVTLNMAPAQARPTSPYSPMPSSRSDHRRESGPLSSEEQLSDSGTTLRRADQQHSAPEVSHDRSADGLPQPWCEGCGR